MWRALRCHNPCAGSDYAFGWLRTETGVHRLVRSHHSIQSNRRHTSIFHRFFYFARNRFEVDINPADLRIDVYRTSGAEDNVNKTESAVRITHTYRPIR